jgi:hypothetical protein
VKAVLLAPKHHLVKNRLQSLKPQFGNPFGRIAEDELEEEEMLPSSPQSKQVGLLDWS